MDTATINFWVYIAMLGFLPIALAIWRSVKQMRENDLKHLDEQFAEVAKGYLRLEAKLDAHIQWHMGAGKE